MATGIPMEHWLADDRAIDTAYELLEQAKEARNDG